MRIPRFGSQGKQAYVQMKSVRRRHEMAAGPGEASLPGPIACGCIGVEEAVNLRSEWRRLARDVELVGAWRRGAAALRDPRLGSCQVAFLDQSLTDIPALRCLRHLKRKAPLCRVLLLVAEPDLPTITAAIRDGAYDFLVKPVSVENAVVAVRQLFEEGALLFANQGTPEDLLHRHLKTGAARPPPTSAEARVLAEVRRGREDKEIAAILHLSIHTVKTHVHHLLCRFRTHHRYELPENL